MDNLQPPTDNLYKFLAIGGIAIIVVALIFYFRAAFAEREKWRDAQVELLATGYQEGSGEPTDPAMRAAYFRRKLAAEETTGVIKTFAPYTGNAILIGGIVSITGFGLWWWKVQSYEDEILRLTAEKLRRDAAEAPASTPLKGASHRAIEPSI